MFLIEFRRGLDRLGIYTLAKHVKLTVRNVIQLLPPQFTEEGTNKIILEKQVYINKFIKYVRETVAGLRITTLEVILVFTTCTDEIPNLAFSKQPRIQFPEVMTSTSLTDDKVRNINILTL